MKLSGGPRGQTRGVREEKEGGVEVGANGSTIKYTCMKT